MESSGASENLWFSFKDAYLTDASHHLNSDVCLGVVTLRSMQPRCAARVCGPTPTVTQGLTAVFLDPPYSVENRADCYDCNEDKTVAHGVREWAIECGNDKRMRIALCGYEGEHVMPESWEIMTWKAHGGYGTQATDVENDNAKRERIWFSPHCLRGPAQANLTFIGDLQMAGEFEPQTDRH